MKAAACKRSSHFHLYNAHGAIYDVAAKVVSCAIALIKAPFNQGGHGSAFLIYNSVLTNEMSRRGARVVPAFINRKQ